MAAQARRVLGVAWLGIVLCLWVAAACSPSQAARDAVATEVAGAIYATETTQARSAVPTATNTAPVPSATTSPTAS